MKNNYTPLFSLLSSLHGSWWTLSPKSWYYSFLLAACFLLEVNTTSSAQVYYAVSDGSATTYNDQIRRINLNGTGDTQVSPAVVEIPGALALDQMNNRLLVVNSLVSNTATPGRTKIVAVSLSNGSSTTLAAPANISGATTTQITGMVVDRTNQYVYYAVSDGSATTYNDQIRRINLNGTGDTQVSPAVVEIPGALALDQMNNRLLVVNSLVSNTATPGRTKIVAVNLSNGTSTTLVTPANISGATTTQITGMVVDHTNQYVYYAVSDGSATTYNDQIRRINLNGTGDTQVATGVVEIPGALALDQMNNRLLVVNSLVSNTATPGRTKIVAVNLSNGTSTTLVTPANISGATTTQITGMVTVEQNPPTVTTTGTSNITSNGASVAGTLVTDGNVALSSYGVVYLPGTATPDITSSKVQVGTSSPPTFPSNFTANLAGLSPATQYTARAYATNSVGTAYGAVQTFTTSANLPTVTTTTPSNITTTAATLGGNVTADGGASVSGRGIVFSTSNTSPTVGGSGVTTSPNGSGTGTFSATISPLTPGTIYYVRAYATNSAGTAYGNVTSFTTTPSSPVFTTPANGTYISITTPTYTGVSQASSTVTVYVDGTALANTATANGVGSWTVTQPTALSLGGHSVYAKATVGGSATSASSNVNSFTVDTVSPTVTISSSAVTNGGTTSSAPIPFTAVFSENVSGFTNSDITVSGGGSSDFSGSGTTYTFNVTPTASGTVTINIAAGAAQDAAGNGNTAATQFVLNYQPTPTITSFTAINPTICSGQVVSFSATLGNVGSGYTYTLSDGTNGISGNGTGTNFSQSLTVNGTGSSSFTLAITSNSQTTTATTPVTVNARPTNASLTGGTVSCAQPSLTITASADGASSYSFSAGASQIGSSNQAVVSQGGTYTVVISSAQGCTVAQTTTIASNTTATPINLTASGALSCSATSVTLTATAGFVSYTFSTGATQVGGSAGNTATVTTAGSYSVSATNASGCVSTTNVTVVGSTTATPVGLTASGPLSCSALSVTLTATAGFSSYTFSTGATQVGGSTGNTATVTTAGTYSVSATNASGCISTTNVTVVGSTTATTVELTVSSAISCTATSVTLTATAGFTSYTFSAGATQVGGSAGNTATVNTSGSYSVSATNASGCVSTTNVTVVGSTTATPVDLTASGPLSCSATSVTLTATAGFTSYAFSAGAVQQGGSASNTATVTAAGTYSVTATNASGCTSTTNVTVVGSTTATPVSLTVSGTLSCSAPSVTLTATAGFTSYTFSTGATQVGGSTGNTATVNASGTYSVTAANASGCLSTTNVTVSGSTTGTPVSLTASGQLSCSAPSVTLTASTGFTSYTFSSGATQVGGSAGNTATVTTAGTYSVAATNASGCVSTTNVTVVGSTTATPVNLTASGPLSCSAPSVTLTATAGFASYTFSAGATQVGGSSGNTATVTAAGTYTVTAANASGCLSTTSVTVTGSTTASPVSLTASGPLSCSAPGVTLTATSGFTSYIFSTGATQVGGSSGNTATVNTAGTYSVTAINASGCQSTTSVTVTGSTTATSINLTTSGALSCSATSVTLTATAGFTSYTFSSGATQVGGSTGNTATVNAAGTYSVSATNASGCVSTTNVTVVGSTTATPVSLTASGPLSCSAPSVTLTATPGFTSYAFSTGTTQQGGSGGNTATVNAAGTYSVTATNASGCQSTTNVTVTGSTTASPVSLTASGTLSCSAPSATLTATPGFTSYVFSAGATQQGGSSGNTATVNVAGTYSVTATSASGCLSTTNVTVVGSTTASPVSLTASGMLSCSITTVTLTATPGFTSYVFSPGASQQGGSAGNTATVSTTGVYSVTATNADGCTSIASVAVTYQNCPQPGSFTIVSVTMLSCSPSGPNRRYFSFTPVYSGLNGQPISFSVVNQLPPTTQTGPYSLDLYTDNPVIVLKATQQGTPGEATFSYNWLNACMGMPAPNTPPSVVSPISPQVATVNQTFSLVIAPGTFTDAETPSSLTYTVTGLPPGLSFSAPNFISGTPSTTVGSPFSVTVTATDPGGLSASTVFPLTVNPASTTASFGITGVNLVNCTTLSPNRRAISFNPVYSGTTGQPISFSVVNELPATTASGPYSLSLYTDNPVIVLKATQQNTPGEASFSYNWLNACNGTPSTNTPPTVANPIGPQSATVNQGYSFNIPANTFTDAQTPSNLALSVSGLPAGLGFTPPATISGTPSTSAGSPFSVTVTATDPGGLSTFTTFQLTVNPQSTTPPSNFAITGATLVNCSSLTPNRRAISFNPVYSGLNGQQITFSVVNELAPTTAAGPYQLNLYTDNPVIVLKATQQGTPGEASFNYNWLAACNNVPSTNTPPTVANPIGPQSATINVSYNFNIPANTFTDAETPGSLALSVSGLPAGLNFTPPANISGTPSVSMAAPYSVTVTATDPGGLSTFTTFNLTVNPNTSTTSFAITGATLLNCTTLSPNRKSISFKPVYQGATGQPISFSVVNELTPTTDPGPYQLNLYTDNPTIVLKAVQAGTPGEASFNYNWLAACNSMGRLGAPETALEVVVLGNPVVGESVEVGVKGAEGSALRLRVVNAQGKPVHEQTIEQAGANERVRMNVGQTSGIYLLDVSIPGQRQIIKLVKP